MTDTPVPTDTTAQQVVTTVGTLITDGETAAETAIIAAEPWMSTVIVKQIWEACLNFFFGYFGAALQLVTGRIVVDAQEYFAYKSAAQALAALQAANASGDPNAITTANQAADAAATPVLRFIGTVTPTV